ncbi:MAG TPA: hypothetical protein VFJ50_09225 [Gemmatimonadales bacterium]|nr:hypothetical protein [Gemmatimonadales bacterium]
MRAKDREFEDDSGYSPNVDRPEAEHGSPGFNVKLEDGPLHGRDARLVDSSFRLWYVVGDRDRPTVYARRGRPTVRPREQIIGYYELDFASELVRWHRDEPTG